MRPVTGLARWRVHGLVAAVLLLATGCGLDDGAPTSAQARVGAGPGTAGSDATDRSSAAGSTEAPAATAGRRFVGGSAGAPVDPCDRLSAVDVQRAYDVPVGVGSPRLGRHQEDDATFFSRDCAWSGPQGFRVSVGHTQADDFDGAPVCPPPVHHGEDATALGGLPVARGYWSAYAGLADVEGRLRLCTESALVDIEVDTPVGSRTPQQLLQETRTFATAVLDAL